MHSLLSYLRRYAHRSTSLVALLCLLTSSACRSYDEVEVMTQLELSLQLPEGIQPEALQLELLCSNVNTGERITQNGITQLQLSQRLLRGLYNLSLEGTIIYSDSRGRHVQRLQGRAEYLQLLRGTEQHRLTLELLRP